jgi:hypothetical protein
LLTTYALVADQSLHVYDTIPTESLAAIEAIALQCPLAGGEGVFLARRLLAKIGRQDSLYWNECPQTSSKKSNVRSDDHEPKKQDKLSQLEIESIVRVYPNPVSDKLMVEYANLQLGNRVSLINLLGVEVAARTIESTSGLLDIDTTVLSSGVYYLKVVSEGKISYHQKIVKTQR